MAQYFRWMKSSGSGGGGGTSPTRKNAGEHNHHHNNNIILRKDLGALSVPNKPRSRSLDARSLEASGIRLLLQNVGLYT